MRTLTYLIILLFLSVFVSAETVYNPATKGWVEANYCKNGGFCAFSSINVTNATFTTVNTQSFNVSGNVTAPIFCDSNTGLCYTLAELNASTPLNDTLGSVMARGNVASTNLNMSDYNILDLGDIYTKQTDIVINSTSANSFRILGEDGSNFFRINSQYKSIGILAGVPSSINDVYILGNSEPPEYDAVGTNAGTVRMATGAGAGMLNTTINVSKAGNGGTISILSGGGGSINLVSSNDANYTGGNGGTLTYSSGNGGSATTGGGAVYGNKMSGGNGGLFNMGGGNGAGGSYANYVYGGNGGSFILDGGVGGNAYNAKIYGIAGDGGNMTLRGGDSGLLTNDTGPGDYGYGGSVNLETGANKNGVAAYYGAINFKQGTSLVFGRMFYGNAMWNFLFNGAVNITNNLTTSELKVNGKSTFAGDINQTAGNATINQYHGGAWFYNGSGVPFYLNKTFMPVNMSNTTHINGLKFVPPNKLQLVAGDGIYFVQWKASGYGTVNHIYEGMVYVNYDRPAENTYGHTEGSTNNLVEMGGFGYVKLNAGEYLTLNLRDSSGTTAGTAQAINLIGFRVSGNGG